MNSRESLLLPNFFILGAAKAGTTALYEMLKQHPDIFLPRQKETQFFFDDKKYANGLGWYLRTHFRNADRFSARGEASPSYFQCPDRVAPRLLENLGVGGARFLVVLRDPVERAWSHYLHRRRVCSEMLPFAEALKVEGERLSKNPVSWAGYFSDGLYGKLVETWYGYFARDAFLFLRYEDLRMAWRESLARIALHLGVDTEFNWRKRDGINSSGVPRSRALMRALNNMPSPAKSIGKKLFTQKQLDEFKTTLRNLNTKREHKPIMDMETETSLRHRYLADIERLEDLLDEDFSHWKPTGLRHRGLMGAPKDSATVGP